MINNRKEHHHFEKSIDLQIYTIGSQSQTGTTNETPTDYKHLLMSMFVNEVRCSLTNAFHLSCSRVEPLLHRCQRSWCSCKPFSFTTWSLCLLDVQNILLVLQPNVWNKVQKYNFSNFHSLYFDSKILNSFLTLIPISFKIII